MSLINDALFHFICYRIASCGCFKIPSGTPDSHHYVCYWFVIIINVPSLYPFIMEIFLVFRKCQWNHMIYVTPLLNHWIKKEIHFFLSCLVWQMFTCINIFLVLASCQIFAQYVFKLFLKISSFCKWIHHFLSFLNPFVEFHGFDLSSFYLLFF